MLGFIYIMSNPAHSGLLKIGQTSKDPLVRRKDLSSTGVPEEFVIEYQALASDYRRQEKLIHQKLNKVRHSSKKEFFSVSVPEAINTIREQLGDKIKYEEVFHTTPEELKKVSRGKTIKGFFKAIIIIFGIVLFGQYLIESPIIQGEQSATEGGMNLPPELFILLVLVVIYIMSRKKRK